MLNNNKNLKKLVTSISTLICILFTSSLSAQENYLLTNDEIDGYTIESQSKSHWAINEQNQIIYGISQEWVTANADHKIIIDYYEFENSYRALTGTSYSALGHSAPYFWGSINGNIIADGSWNSISGGALYFVRGNIGIAIVKIIGYSINDKIIIDSISSKLLTKIESNLSHNVISYELGTKQKQITNLEFQIIVNPVFTLSEMEDFSPHSIYDSKWATDTTNLVIGIRKEWKDDSGSVIGIDICQFDSGSLALDASEIHGKFAGSKVFHLDDIDSLRSIITEWQQLSEPSFHRKNQFSVVGYKDNIGVHFYQYEPSGIDTNLIYSVIEKLSEQVSNF